MSRPQQHRPDAILAAAATLFVSDGVNVSTARIAQAAGVSNGTLFNYFPTKQALIDALYISIKRDLSNAVGDLDHDDPVEHRMHLTWDRWIGWLRGNSEAHIVVKLLHDAGLASEQAQAEAMSALAGPLRVLDDAASSGRLVDLPIGYLGALVQHHLDQAVASGLDDRQSDIAFHALWNAIARPPSPPTTPHHLQETST